MLSRKLKDLSETEILGYRVHKDKMCCSCVEIKCTLNGHKEVELNQFAKDFRLKEYEITNESTETEITFIVDYKKFRFDFEDIYESKMPNFNSYATYPKVDIDKLYLIVYKSKDSQKLQTKFIEDSVHEFCEHHKELIERSILIRKRRFSWEIIGTGCSCSSFNPLQEDEIEDGLIDRKIVTKLSDISSTKHEV